MIIGFAAEAALRTPVMKEPCLLTVKYFQCISATDVIHVITLNYLFLMR